MTITGTPLPAPLHEGMQFAVAHHTEVSMRLSTLWEAVSLTAQSTLECLPTDTSQAGVVGEMVVKFWEQAEWCSRLETSGSRVYSFTLGLVNSRAHLVARLEEAAGNFGQCKMSSKTIIVRPPRSGT
jgi:hypothetical protein